MKENVLLKNHQLYYVILVLVERYNSLSQVAAVRTGFCLNSSVVVKIFFRSQDRDLDKMNSSTLESQDHGLEITTLLIVISGRSIVSVPMTLLLQT